MTEPCRVLKVDTELGVVFGFAIISRIDGEPYVDSQGDFIDEPVMLEAATKFMSGDRAAKEMHIGDAIGHVVFCWPLTADVSRAMGISSAMTGLAVGVRFNDEAVLAKFKRGELTGFSIGGTGKREART